MKENDQTVTRSRRERVHAAIHRLARQIGSADAIVVGAGAGLSVSAGFTYSGRRFKDHFSDFIAEYHFRDMYSGGFYPFPSLEEQWAYWSRYILINRYQDAPKPVYQELLELVGDRNYFVLTTNVDHCFQKAGFDQNRLFYTQGDYGLWQCSKPCHTRTYDNETQVRQMAALQRNRKIPAELVPHCPICQKPMIMNLRCDHTFVQDEGWYQAKGRYEEFLRRNLGLRMLFLELGVGENTPSIIKYPFRQMVYDNPKSMYAYVNLESSPIPPEISGRSVSIQGDIGRILREMKGERGRE